MTTLSWNRLPPLLLLIAAGAASGQAVRAADLLVYSNNDSGSGSLRQAIADNASMGGGNNIVFSNGVASPIALAGGLSISNDVAIVGPGDKVLAVAGNSGGSVFQFVSNATVTISGLTITGGFNGVQGGGMLQESGSLTLLGCTIASNVASGYGAGIYAAGSLTVSNCSFINNSAEISGGGIYQPSGDLTLDSSLFSQNSTGFAGGGGVYYAGSQGLIRNCTFTGNHASSGSGLFNAGSTGIGNCTFSGNTGGSGIQDSTTAFIRNTIVAGNASGGAGSDCAGAFTSLSYNFIGIKDGSTGFTATGDQTGSITNPINPQLGPLQDNGGPTMTMALIQGSPCIDQGGSGFGPDQRGMARPFDFPTVANASGGNGSDIGAYELGPPPLSIQEVSGNIVLSWPNNYGSYHVEFETDLTLNNWGALAIVRVPVGNQFTATVWLDPGNKFYRLITP